MSAGLIDLEAQVERLRGTVNALADIIQIQARIGAATAEQASTDEPLLAGFALPNRHIWTAVEHALRTKDFGDANPEAVAAYRRMADTVSRELSAPSAMHDAVPPG